MIELTDRQRRFAGWTFSILFNIGLLIIGAVWLIRPVRFQVEEAPASTEIDLVAESTPAPVLAPPAPPPPPTPSPPVPVVTPAVTAPPEEPSPFPSEEPAPVPEVTKPLATAAPASPVVPLPPVPAKPHPAKPAPSPKVSSTRATSNASRGATNAHPDELHNEPPQYPEESRIAREEGLVVLRVEVSSTGQPVRVSIVQSSGHARLDQAAQQAVQHWKFHSATTAGIPVPSEVDVPVRFKLE